MYSVHALHTDAPQHPRLPTCYTLCSNSCCILCTGEGRGIARGRRHLPGAGQRCANPWRRAQRGAHPTWLSARYEVCPKRCKYCSWRAWRAVAKSGCTHIYLKFAANIHVAATHSRVLQSLVMHCVCCTSKNGQWRWLPTTACKEQCADDRLATPAVSGMSVSSVAQCKHGCVGRAKDRMRSSSTTKYNNF